AIISGVRRRIQTGLPRHSTVIISPGASLLTSASTGAPAARARADGVRLATKGTAVAATATPPAALVAIRRLRRCLRISSIGGLQHKCAFGGLCGEKRSGSGGVSLNHCQGDDRRGNAQAGIAASDSLRNSI